jgi:hypothetical protein
MMAFVYTSSKAMSQLALRGGFLATKGSWALQ